MMWVTSKATIVLSNVPGPKVGLTYRGVVCTGFIALVPGLGDLAFGITAMSMAETMFVAVQSDTSYVEDPTEIRTIIERNYDELSKIVGN